MMLKALNTLLVLVANVGTLALDETLVDSVAPAGFNMYASFFMAFSNLFSLS
jgi:hypothetical protein